MFELHISDDEEELTPIVFDDFEEAVKAFKDNNRIGLKCALFNFNFGDNVYI